MLANMLRNHQNFQELPITQRDIYLRLAHAFDDVPEAVQLSANELVEHTGIGSKQTWQDFLNMDIVRQYIRAQVANVLDVAHRKAIKSLTSRAMEGNVQAITELNKLSDIFNQESNKIIVLHQIQRPKKIYETLSSEDNMIEE